MQHLQQHQAHRVDQGLLGSRRDPADRSRQEDWAWLKHLTSCQQRLWQADSPTEKYDMVIMSVTALIMPQSWQRVWHAVQLTYRVALGTIISRRSAAAGRSSSSWWASLSLLTGFSSDALMKNASQACHRENHRGRSHHFDVSMLNKPQDLCVIKCVTTMKTTALNILLSQWF